MKDDLIRPIAQAAYEYRCQHGHEGSPENDWELGQEYINGKWHFLTKEVYIKMAFENKLGRRIGKISPLKKGWY